MSEFLDWLRTETENADQLSAKSLEKNATAHVKNAFARVDADEYCELAGNHVTVKCTQLAQRLVGMTSPTKTEKEAIEELRAESLEAIDAFKKECARCGPSDARPEIGH